MEAVRPALRVGVFSDSPQQSRWICEALARAGATPWAEIALVAIDAPPAERTTPVPLLWRAYRRMDRAMFGSTAEWSRKGDLNQLVAPARRIPMGGPPNAWRSRVCDARLDVAFVIGDFDDARLDGLARFGTWRFCFGEGQGTCEPLAAMREVLAGDLVVASGIRIRTGCGKPDRVAHRSWARSFPFSVTRSRDAMFAKSADVVARALHDLHAAGSKWIELGTEPIAAVPAERFPGMAKLIGGISTLGARVALRARQKALTLDTWSLAFRFGDDETFDGSLDGFRRLDPPKGWYWADPFPIERNGRHYIFFEELPHGAPKAHISVVEVSDYGFVSAPTKVLERDYHLSYPFLIEEDGELYMIPETAQNHTVEIYRCVDFPTKWKLERVLVEGRFCADATLHREDDRWWMFVNVAASGESINDELHIFSADRLLGEWSPHPRNPVKSDVRGARPAGRLYREAGILYRPGQVCAPLYGSAIALHRVTRLTPEDYCEVEERRIEPRDARTLGIHTFNRAGSLTVTDAFERRPRF